jgi:hypothetical protein
MKRPYSVLASCIAIGMAVSAMSVAKGQTAEQPMEEPLHDSGQSITGAFEGWYRNSDGSASFLLGYYSRNAKQVVDIPIGPDNRIEPGGPDQGQPTHFLPRRQWGIFSIKVPKDFGENKLQWRITANGKTTTIPISLNPLWELSPFKEESIGNTPPVLGFDEGGATIQGPGGLTKSITGSTAEPLPLTVFVADDAKPLPASRRTVGPPVTITWSEFRGPAPVKFEKEKPAVEKGIGRPIADAPFFGKAATSATFSQPGEYVLHVVANDWSGEGGRGFQCCWTYGNVKVTVK